MSLITHFRPLITHSEEKDVGFEDHVLLDHLLEGFPPKGEVWCSLVYRPLTLAFVACGTLG